MWSDSFSASDGGAACKGGTVDYRRFATSTRWELTESLLPATSLWALPAGEVLCGEATSDEIGEAIEFQNFT
jgi:hypothetical protein